jgi:hypothetical protein
VANFEKTLTFPQAGAREDLNSDSTSHNKAILEQEIIGVSIKQFVCLAFGGLVVLLTGTGANAQSTCTRSDTLPSGTSPTWYVSVASSEHADSQRTQVFGRTCTLTEVTQSKRLRIRVRQAPGTYPAIYNVVTRNRNELYVFGGNAGQSSGAYVARLDPETLVELWRTPLQVNAGQWSYLGVMAVHGNGFLYAVTSNLLVKLDPTTGAILASLALPQLPADKGGTGAAYNGFVSPPTASSSPRASSAGRAPPMVPRVCSVPSTTGYPRPWQSSIPAPCGFWRRRRSPSPPSVGSCRRSTTASTISTSPE